MLTKNLERSSAGFTLIELLIVVAIMGLLATAVYVAINPTANLIDTRNSRRLSDISAMQSALQAYWLANSYAYPATANIKTTLVPTYISGIPVDPSGNPYGYCSAGGAGNGFGLGIALETGGTGTGITNVMKSSVPLASMPVGCTAAANFKSASDGTSAASTACDSATIYCIRGTGT